MSADDFRDYLNQQAQAQAAAQRLADITRDPEREAADLEQVVENGAREQIGAIADQAEAMDDGLVSLVSETRDLRSRITSGSLTVDEAKKALLDLRQRHGRLSHGVKTLRPRYDALAETVKNPGARRDELIAKYGL